MWNRAVRFFRRRFARVLYSLASIVTPKDPPGMSLAGDRHIEWSWILAHLPDSGGKALDVGPGSSPLLSLGMLQKGFQVLALDIEKQNWLFVDRDLELKRADLLTGKIPPTTFDVIICCSMIEHVGITGRYGDQHFVPEGDLQVMRRLGQATKPGGTMLLTVPVGMDAVFAPVHRVYGAERLPKLLQGWRIHKERYWVKETDDCWYTASRDEALARPGSKRHYALGCFVLIKE
ncbi:MAG: DUF268 domain-containing protein [Chloroflexi bacterium]|nr:DUF268 domain-containing protein [Chloroflexota bacterium]